MSIPLKTRIIKNGDIMTNNILLARETDTVKSILSRYSEELGCSVKAYIGDESSNFNPKRMSLVEDMEIKFEHVKIVQSNFSHLLILIDSNTDPPIIEENALSKLMASSNKKILPKAKNEKNGKDALYNKILIYLEKREVGFFVQEEQQMKDFLDCLLDALWLLDGQHDKIEKVTGNYKIPKCFKFDRIFHQLHYKGQLKKKVGNLNQGDLISIEMKLERMVQTKPVTEKKWNVVKTDLESLILVINKYTEHLQDTIDTKTQKETENSLPNRKMYVIEGTDNSKPMVKVTYKHLEEALEGMDTYLPVNIALYAPVERRSKYKYIQGLQLSMSVQVFRCFSPIATFIWKLPIKEERDESNTATTIAYLEQFMDEIVKNDKKKLADNHFGNLILWSPSEIRNLAELITDDTSTSNETEKDVQFLLDDGFEMAEIVDIENQATKSSKGRFDNFWNAATEILNTDITVPHDRRHNDNLYIAPIALSLRHLMEMVEIKMEKMYPNSPENCIPSQEYFRLQFLPRKTNSSVAKKFYGRFPIKYGIQQRTLHRPHVDQHYGAKQFQYMKKMAKMFPNEATCFLLDDKASIGIGPPDAPVGAIRRQRPILLTGLDERGLNSCDHDNIPMHLTPSVSMKFKPPTNNADWYKGLPQIILKCAIFETSNGWRHMAELIKRYNSDEDQPIVFIGTDGGSDHKTTNISVILSYIAVAMELDLDALVAVRTPPHYSIINPVERFMSTVNIALNGISVQRKSLEEVKEKKIRHLFSKTQWREAAAKHPETNYREIANETTLPVKNLLKKRFEALKYHNETVAVGEPATDEEIRVLKSSLWNVLPDVDLNDEKLSKKTVLNHETFKEFAANHIRLTTYSITYKKCDDSSCNFHGPIKSDPPVFNKLKWLPTPKPMASNTNKYMDFDEVYGSDPSDEFCPSISEKTEKANQRRDILPPFQLAYTRARMVVWCTECSLPRMVYTQKQLTPTQVKQINNFLEQNSYTCGSPINVPEVYINAKDVCHAPISKHYFDQGSKLKGFRMMCYKCGGENPEHQSKFKNLLICQECYIIENKV